MQKANKKIYVSLKNIHDIHLYIRDKYPDVNVYIDPNRHLELYTNVCDYVNKRLNEYNKDENQESNKLHKYSDNLVDYLLSIHTFD